MFFTVFNSDVNYHFGGKTRIQLKDQDYQDDEKDETSTCIKDLFLLAGNLVGSPW